jgi:heat shock protein HslJ
MKTARFVSMMVLFSIISLCITGCGRPATNTPAGVTPDATTTALAKTPIGPQPPAANGDLTVENTIWLLRDFASDGLKPLLAIYWVTLQLNPVDATVSGVSACNQYSSSYTLQGANLSFKPIMSTMMACGEMPGAVEKAYQTALAQVASYQITGNSLVLSDSHAKMLLRFENNPFGQAQTFTYQELANATYQSELSASGSVTLVNGEYRDPSQAGTALIMSNYAAFGDVTGDGQEDAVLVLIATGGGSGTFYYLTVVQHQGEALLDARTLIGDRVRLNSLQIAGKQIVVDMLQAGPNDPQCCPSIQAIQRYQWTGAKLELLDTVESR